MDSISFLRNASNSQQPADEYNKKKILINYVNVSIFFQNPLYPSDLERIVSLLRQLSPSFGDFSPLRSASNNAISRLTFKSVLAPDAEILFDYLKSNDVIVSGISVN